MKKLLLRIITGTCLLIAGLAHAAEREVVTPPPAKRTRMGEPPGAPTGGRIGIAPSSPLPSLDEVADRNALASQLHAQRERLEDPAFVPGQEILVANINAALASNASSAISEWTDILRIRFARQEARISTNTLIEIIHQTITAVDASDEARQAILNHWCELLFSYYDTLNYNDLVLWILHNALINHAPQAVLKHWTNYLLSHPSNRTDYQKLRLLRSVIQPYPASIVKLLLDAGCPYYSNNSSTDVSALIHAVILNKSEVVSALIAHDQHINTHINLLINSQTACDEAISTGYHEILAILRAHGGKTAAELKAERAAAEKENRWHEAIARLRKVR